MSNKVEKKLTEGPIFKTLAKLALPIMASSFLSTAYSITDMAWIGRLGAKAVAGVGVGGMYLWFSSAFVALTRMGGQVLMAQSIGSGNKEEARHFGHAAIWLTVIFGVVFGVLSVCFVEPLIALLGVDDPVTVGHAKVYMRLTCGLVIFSYMGRVLTGLYTAQGDSHTPLKANLVGLATNMVLDPLLILGVGPVPGLGVLGAAIATLFAHVLVLFVLVRGIFYNGKKENLLREVRFFEIPKARYIKGVLKMGVPAGLQSMIYCVISMVLTRFASVYGDEVIATQRVGENIESISWNTADGFGAAMNAFAGQNYGAGKYERIRKGYKMSAIMLLLWGMLVMLVFFIFSPEIATIFFHEEEVIPYAVKYLMIIGISEPFMCIELLAIGAISGMGNTKLCSIISVTFTSLRIPIAYALSHMGLGIAGIWWAMAVTSIMKGVVLHVAFYRESRGKSLQ